MHHLAAEKDDERKAVSSMTNDAPTDRGPVFDGVRIGRPATGALIDAGYRTVLDLPADLAVLSALHGVGPSAIRRLAEARDDRR